MNKTSVSVDDLTPTKKLLRDAVANVKKHPSVRYADIRLEANEGVGSYSEDGTPKMTNQDWSLSLGVRVIEASGVPAAGYFGKHLGIPDLKHIDGVLKESLSVAQERARANSIAKHDFKQRSGSFGATVAPTELALVPSIEDVVPAEFEIDPRGVTPKEMTEFAQTAASAAKSFHPFIKRVELVVNTGVSRQVFASSGGSLIDQSFCSSGVTVFVLAQNDKGDMPVDLYHHTGNQLGLEALSKGINAHKKTAREFAREIAHEAVLLADAKPAPAEEKPVTIVLDPDLIALFAHEIIGHPSELDRALKMEAGYAGRSWFLTDLEHSMVGQRIGSPLLTAFSDPTRKGAYGYYKYDDEGTPARRVTHIENGIYRDFMNSRQTAAIVEAEPNGHYKANDASVVPLIRMSVSAIAGGSSDPESIIQDVDEGYYCVGHRIPSISESRENFQISPRLMYKIRHGRVEEVYRDGRITADSRDFFMSIDAVGNDFTIFPIPNCGKGQPMQTKQVGNGGPTARGRARIARGE